MKTMTMKKVLRAILVPVLAGCGVISVLYYGLLGLSVLLGYGEWSKTTTRTTFPTIAQPLVYFAIGAVFVLVGLFVCCSLLKRDAEDETRLSLKGAMASTILFSTVFLAGFYVCFVSTSSFKTQDWGYSISYGREQVSNDTEQTSSVEQPATASTPLSESFVKTSCDSSDVDVPPLVFSGQTVLVWFPPRSIAAQSP